MSYDSVKHETEVESQKLTVSNVTHIDILTTVNTSNSQLALILQKRNEKFFSVLNDIGSTASYFDNKIDNCLADIVANKIPAVKSSVLSDLKEKESRSMETYLMSKNSFATLWIIKLTK